MAVQAQYPSNILLLKRDAQEGKNALFCDYSLQPQPGGNGGGGVFGSVDQPHALFNNGVDSRKRAREVATTTLPINLLISKQLQSQQTQLIDLSQLHTHNPQSNGVSTGLRLAFEERPQNQSAVLSSLLPDDFSVLIKQQMVEIDHLIRAQGEQLRRTLADKRQRQHTTLLMAAEESAAKRLKEKEAEVEKVARRNAELEARAAQLAAQAQAWQARAVAQEATAAMLQAELRRALTTGGRAVTRSECDECEGVGDAGDAESAYVDPERVTVSSCGGGGPSCKACRRRVASVVLFPCRHLCLCTECNGVLHACPLCMSVRSSSIEVLLT